MKLYVLSIVPSLFYLQTFPSFRRNRKNWSGVDTNDLHGCSHIRIIAVPLNNGGVISSLFSRRRGAADHGGLIVFVIVSTTWGL